MFLLARMSSVSGKKTPTDSILYILQGIEALTSVRNSSKKRRGRDFSTTSLATREKVKVWFYFSEKNVHDFDDLK